MFPIEETIGRWISMEIKPIKYNTSLYKDGYENGDPFVLLVRQLLLRDFRRYYGLRDQIAWELRFELMELSQWKLAW